MQLTKINHPIYSNQLTTDCSIILFDFRINNNYSENKSEMILHISNPEKLIAKGCDILNCEKQKFTGKDAKELRMQFSNRIISHL